MGWRVIPFLTEKNKARASLIIKRNEWAIPLVPKIPGRLCAIAFASAFAFPRGVASLLLLWGPRVWLEPCIIEHAA